MCGQHFGRTGDRTQLCKMLTLRFWGVRVAFRGDLGEQHGQETGAVAPGKGVQNGEGHCLNPPVGSRIFSTLCRICQSSWHWPQRLQKCGHRTVNTEA